MIDVSRGSSSIYGQWWWTVDRMMLFAFLLLMLFGILSAAAATPMVADRLGIAKFYFLKRHLIYLIPSLTAAFCISAMDDANIKKFSLVLFAVSLFFTALTLFFGVEIKGARRWISFFGFSAQPSEFVRPALVVITAWMLSKRQKYPEFRGNLLSAFFLIVFVSLLVLQPDVGMAAVSVSVWFGQVFLNGLAAAPVIIIAVLAGLALFLAYLFLPHVTVRVDRFLDPTVGDHYQINRSLEAFAGGGLTGIGPGEGIVKKHLPDAHSDFVFSVLGEEFGFFVCVLVTMIIAFIVVYGMLKTVKEKDLFVILASVGLLAQFGLQCFINIASALHMIPTKGMPLPFMSYGGSSMLSANITAGMILALGRRRISPSPDLR
ncbi:MAG: FtsW/RodA/SpoVE family cell cycle protein [Holosporaceae bacterium]|jgi:cell division protein FtsW|nr:FtsW/RodA/SpoVE family cell cycle protein [Holosporaceae bacterium]